jgi:hypothetical protein
MYIGEHNMHDFVVVAKLAHWMVDTIGKNKEQVLDPENGADWDWIAAEVWEKYTGVFNEYIINDAIDFLMEAAESQE